VKRPRELAGATGRSRVGDFSTHVVSLSRPDFAPRAAWLLLSLRPRRIRRPRLRLKKSAPSGESAGPPQACCSDAEPLECFPSSRCTRRFFRSLSSSGLVPKLALGSAGLAAFMTECTTAGPTPLEPERLGASRSVSHSMGVVVFASVHRHLRLFYLTDGKPLLASAIGA